jgi:ProP effector
MPFSELASFRDQLAQQAAAEKIANQKLKPAQPAKNTTPVDPVVLIIGRLQKQFPIAFPKNPAPKVPLKLGIHKDLFELSESMGISKIELREAIKTWCAGSRYWRCAVDGAVRFDLEGNAAGCVTKIEADIATSRLKNRRQKNKKEPNVVSPLPAEQQAVSS